MNSHLKVITIICLLPNVLGGIINPSVNNHQENDGLFSVPRDQVTFRLWTKHNRNTFRPIFFGHLDIADNIRTDKPFKFIIHGWTDNADKGWYDDIKNSYLENGDYNVIGVDWSKPASALYPLSVQYTTEVGQYVGELIVDLYDTLKIPMENVHLIGHSLGAHISGYAGKYAQKNRKGKVGRITGLDPAGPLFLLAGENGRLSSGDANFVDIIHTDGGKLGLSKEIGHADFYPNGGNAPQPGCLFFGIVETASCSHTRSYDLFRESIKSTGFISKECENYSKFKNGECDNNKVALMGENVDITTSGVYYLYTNGREPFAMNQS